jgi:hypothetical protein
VATAAETTREERIEEQLRGIPAKPGVYLFRDAKGAVLYVGKAKSLRARVRSYFRGGDARLGLDRLIERVEQIEVIVTSTEVEAFHLEQNLIKRHRPTFNVRLRDDKSYPYIRVTNEMFPRIFPTRRVVNDGSQYFGPYTDVGQMRSLLRTVKRIFPIRSCNFNFTAAIIAKKKITPEVWTHVAETRDAEGRLRIFQNGELDADESKPMRDKFERCRVGWTAPAKGTQGWLTEYRVWNRARSVDEIRTDFDRSYANDAVPVGLVQLYSATNWGKLQNGAKVSKTADFPLR